MASELQDEHYYVEVTPHDLDASKYIELVADDAVGGISTFHGVTRNNIMGKEVLRLEYEAYVPMAVKKLAVSCPLEPARLLTVAEAALHTDLERRGTREARVCLPAAAAVCGCQGQVRCDQGGDSAQSGHCGHQAAVRHHRSILPPQSRLAAGRERWAGQGPSRRALRAVVRAVRPDRAD
jgi:hypothetical protein